MRTVHLRRSLPLCKQYFCIFCITPRHPVIRKGFMVKPAETINKLCPCFVQRKQFHIAVDVVEEGVDFTAILCDTTLLDSMLQISAAFRKSVQKTPLRLFRSLIVVLQLCNFIQFMAAACDSGMVDELIGT